MSVCENVEEAGLRSAAAPRLQLSFIHNVHHLSQSFVPQRLHDGSKLYLLKGADMTTLHQAMGLEQDKASGTLVKLLRAGSEFTRSPQQM